MINRIFTPNPYTGLLDEFEKNYIEAAPITHAKNLEGKLLLMYGTGDDNVRYQATERLINELRKNNRQFDFMSSQIDVMVLLKVKELVCIYI